MIEPPTKEFLKKLYSSGKSMMQITNETQYSDHTVRYWMAKYNIKRRSRSEAAYQRANPNGDPFKIKNKLTSSDKFLMGLGLGIFWGEGTKTNKNSVRVTNTNPQLILKFRQFLLEICGVEPWKVQYALISFKNIPVHKTLNYWSDELSIPKSKFTKVVKIPSLGKGTYMKKSSHGVCTIIVNNLKLKVWVDKQLENF